MAQGIQATTELKGPLFKNAGPITNKVTNAFVQRLIELGEQKIDMTLRPRPGGVYLNRAQTTRDKFTTGHYNKNIKGTVYNMVGVIEDGFPEKVIYGPWLEGVSSRNMTTRFKGYATFRRTQKWLDSRVKAEAQSFMKNYIRRLGG